MKNSGVFHFISVLAKTCNTQHYRDLSGSRGSFSVFTLIVTSSLGIRKVKPNLVFLSAIGPLLETTSTTSVDSPAPGTTLTRTVSPGKASGVTLTLKLCPQLDVEIFLYLLAKLVTSLLIV